MRLFRGKRAYMAPLLTIGYVFFSILMFIVIASFNMDGEDIGRTNNQDGYINRVNTSETSASISYSERGWVSSFFVTLDELPWWVSAFMVTFQLVMITVVILCWVRGL